MVFMIYEIHSEPIVEQIAEKLRDAINQGDLTPGQKIVEQDICNKFQVSRTPVREAFRILQAEGYLIYKPRSGMFVNEVTIKTISEIWEIRIAIEELVARKTASNADEGLKAQIRNELNKIDTLLKKEIVKESEFSILDETYYELHVSNTGSRTLEDLAKNMRMSSSHIRHKPKYTEGRARQALAEIKNIYQAYLNNDVEEAAKYNKEHFLASLEEIKHYL